MSHYYLEQVCFLYRNTKTEQKREIFPFPSLDVLGVALWVTSIRSFLPLTSSPPSLCSQTPLRQGCSRADLLWFSWTRRRQTAGEKERRERKEREIRSEKQASSSHPDAAAALVSSELGYSSQGQRDAANKGGFEGERCKKKARGGRALHTDADLGEETGLRGETRRKRKGREVRD